jgi:hypothetical protein
VDRAALLQNPEVDSKTAKEAMKIAVNEIAVLRWGGSKSKDADTCPGPELDAGTEEVV